MIVFKLLSFHFMCDNNTINWNTKTLTVNSKIDYLYLSLTYYPEQSYKLNIKATTKSTTKATTKATFSNPLTLISKWNKFIEYWNDTIKDYSKEFNIEFDKLKINTDYSLSPLYITENTIYIGIILLKPNLINTNLKKTSYYFLSEIKSYECKNKVTINNYNFINGILNKNNNYKDNNYKDNNYKDNKINKNDSLKNKEFILDTQKKIPLNYILQNSLNYIPNLEIIRVKKNFQNLLNP